MIAVTANFNPAPLVTVVLVLSTVKTSPTWYPVPAALIATAVTTWLETVTLTVHPLPLPVKATVGTAVVLLNEYPVPPTTTSSVEIGAPCPSIIPVTLWSSASPAAPVLTFLPIGKLEFVLVPPPSIVTFNFRGNERTGLLVNTWVLKLPGAIGVL